MNNRRKGAALAGATAAIAGSSVALTGVRQHDLLWLPMAFWRGFPIGLSIGMILVAVSLLARARRKPHC